MMCIVVQQKHGKHSSLQQWLCKTERENVSGDVISPHLDFLLLSAG